MNVLPSAPPQLYPTQELTQLNAEDFRLKKINDLLKELSDEVEHYRQVAKKYKRSHSMVHASAVGLGSLSVGLSSGALATALTGFGIVASPALAGVATICGLGSVGFAAASKRLERKVTSTRRSTRWPKRRGTPSTNWSPKLLLTNRSVMLSFASSHAKLRSITSSRLRYARVSKLLHKRQPHRHKDQTLRNSKKSFARK